MVRRGRTFKMCFISKHGLQVRWRSFNILLVQATVALLALHAAVNDLLPLLPGSELKHAPRPPRIESARHPSELLAKCLCAHRYPSISRRGRILLTPMTGATLNDYLPVRKRCLQCS